MSDVKFCAKCKLVKEEMHSKKLPKTAIDRQKQEKKHIYSYKSTNIFGISCVKLQSNGTTPGLEKWCNKKSCPKKLNSKWPMMGWNHEKNVLIQTNKPISQVFLK